MLVSTVDEVGVMGKVGGPPDDVALMENGRGEDDIGKVGAAAGVGVVADEGIPVLDFGARVALQNGLDDTDQRAQMNGDMLGLIDGSSLRVEERGGAIAPFLDVGRIGGPDQGLSHLLGDGGNGVSDHLDHDGIDGLLRGLPGFGHAGSTSMIRFRYLSTVPTCPGRIRVVESICSTMAGPVSRLPGFRSSLS